MIVVFLLIVAVDQLVKYWAYTSLRPVGSIPVINQIFHLTYTENTGAAFSMLSGQGLFLTVVPILACGLILYLLFSRRVDHPLGRWALLFLLSGAVGNLIDRVFRGFVVDFIDFRVIRFAIFNVADIFITIGAVLLFVYLLFFSETRHKA